MDPASDSARIRVWLGRAPVDTLDPELTAFDNLLIHGRCSTYRAEDRSRARRRLLDFA
ncbi:MAG TPA: hypothetical protein VKY90_19470 [Candidatus Dormibacteraeota bacterium]|nr:hypothetical protein [Candidatus Dormibacteraeota bacterium]